jgi:quercetin dioxygenase-like cupin family protein
MIVLLPTLYFFWRVPHEVAAKNEEDINLRAKSALDSVGMNELKNSEYFIDPREAPLIKQFEGLETTILTGLHGERMMMVLTATLPGHSVPVHSHPHEQIGTVYSGKAILRIANEERIVEKGDFYRIPADVPHGDTCIGDKPFVMLDIFCPVREDFIKKLGALGTSKA